MRDSLWSPSRKTEQTPAHQELLGRVMDAMRSGSIDDIGSGWYDEEFDSDDAALDDIAREIYERRETIALSKSDHIETSRLLSSWGTLQWGYGAVDDSAGLFPHTMPKIHRPLERLDVAVLSGLVGIDVAGKDKKVDKCSDKLARTPYERLVLLGSVALVAQKIRYEQHYPGVGLEEDSGIVSRVEFYGDFHGDFQMRHVRMFDNVVGPFGAEHAYAPILEPVVVFGYHSIEPEILTNIIIHQARLLEPAALRDFADRILSEVTQRSLVVTPGNFADYGYDDGEYGVRLLENYLRTGENFTDQDMIVYPNPNSMSRLRIESVEDGIIFCNINLENDSKGGQIYVSNSKIEEVVLALIESACNYGRTAPSTLLSILYTARQSY